MWYPKRRLLLPFVTLTTWVSGTAQAPWMLRWDFSSILTPGAWCSQCAQDRGLGQEGAGTASDWYLMFQNLITATSACGLNCIANPQTSSTRPHVRDPMRAVPAVFIPSPTLKIPGHLLRFPRAMSLHSESVSGAPSLGWLSLL